MSNQLLDKSTRQKLQKEITILSNNSLVVNTDMSAVATKDELIDVGQFTSTTQLNPSFVFVTVTLTCFLILIFSIGLIVVFFLFHISLSLFGILLFLNLTNDSDCACETKARQGSIKTQ